MKNHYRNPQQLDEFYKRQTYKRELISWSIIFIIVTGIISISIYLESIYQAY